MNSSGDRRALREMSRGDEIGIVRGLVKGHWRLGATFSP